MDSISVPPNLAVQENHPLKLTHIIERVFQYLNVADLKNCLLISKEWNSTALVQFKKITFKRLDCDKEDVSDRTPARFYADFSNNLFIPFTAFQFKGNWKLSELSNFVQSHKNILHEFYLHNVALFDDRKQSLDSFDITPFISDSPMTRPNTEPNTKLSVVRWSTTKIVIPLSSLLHVRELKLDSCQLILEDQIKPRPVELILRHVQFVKNEDEVTDVCFNDIFDFSRSKKIQISYMELDLRSNNALVTLDYLNLGHGTDIKNWEMWKCSVEMLEMYFVPFIGRTEMKVKTLKFTGYKIDLSFLPTTLETLAVNVTIENECFSSQPVLNLYNLKYLYLNVKAHLSDMISHFVNSPLVELDLSSEEYLSREINFGSIPKTVKKLRLRNVTVNIQEEDSPLNLDKLVLERYSLNTLLGVFTSSYFKTTELVIVGNPDGIIVNKESLGFLKFGKQCLDSNQRFYIGPFYCYDLSFENSRLINYVDQKDRYYIFENGMGKAVDWYEFREMQIVSKYSE